MYYPHSQVVWDMGSCFSLYVATDISSTPDNVSSAPSQRDN